MAKLQGRQQNTILRQQRLGLVIPPSYDYGHWERHAGVEDACNRIALWQVHGGRIWLTSEAVAGKTHLLHALQQEQPQLGLICVSAQNPGHAFGQVQAWLTMLESRAFWAVDIPAGALLPASGLALFHLIERARDMRRPLLVAWRCPEEAMAPPELASRLKSMERIEFASPRSDHELRMVLRSVASSLQWDVKENVLDVLLAQLPRKLDVLIPALKRLETTSIGRGKRRISQAWTRQQIQQLLNESQTSLL
ncbi:MAG: hypothetical protein ACE5F3_06280 [Mariprofundaceae bacterium]